MKTRVTSFRINTDVHDALKSYCDRNGLKHGFFVNQAIVAHLATVTKAEAAHESKEAAHG